MNLNAHLCLCYLQPLLRTKAQRRSSNFWLVTGGGRRRQLASTLVARPGAAGTAAWGVGGRASGTGTWGGGGGGGVVVEKEEVANGSMSSNHGWVDGSVSVCEQWGAAGLLAGLDSTIASHQHRLPARLPVPPPPPSSLHTSLMTSNPAGALLHGPAGVAPAGALEAMLVRFAVGEPVLLLSQPPKVYRHNPQLAHLVSILIMCLYSPVSVLACVFARLCQCSPRSSQRPRRLLQGTGAR